MSTRTAQEERLATQKWGSVIWDICAIIIPGARGAGTLGGDSIGSTVLSTEMLQNRVSGLPETVLQQTLLFDFVRELSSDPSNLHSTVSVASTMKLGMCMGFFFGVSVWDALELPLSETAERTETTTEFSTLKTNTHVDHA